EMFDASVGSCSVMMPFGGKTQLTPSIASVSKIPVLDGKTTSCSILTYGFNPQLMEYSCFTGAMYSVLESMAKTVAVGGLLKETYFSFQEYFERLNKEATRWGKVTQALLGTIYVQDFFNLAAIGGKDSMSGTFNEISVPPTLISFACTHANTKYIVSSEMKQVNSHLGVFVPKINEEGFPDLHSYEAIFNQVMKLTQEKKVLSSYVVDEGGIISCLFKMSLGNRIGFHIDSQLDLLSYLPGAIIIETKDMVVEDYYHELGKTTAVGYEVNGVSFKEQEVFEAWINPLYDLYPVWVKNQTKEVKTLHHETSSKRYATNKVAQPLVCLPVFPGTNCEYDTKRAFEDEGAIGQFVVFKNLNKEDVLNSIDRFVEVLDKSHILALSGGFSSGDEPDGSAKFIVNVLQNTKVKQAIDRLLKREGLIIGICNGFQALIKSGLLPYGEVKTLNDHDATLYRNDIHRHISLMAHTRVASNQSPWLQDLRVGEDHMIAMSHGEGKFICNVDLLQTLIENGQVAFQYVDEHNEASNHPTYNVNGSTYAIEGIVSKCGQILGKMGHSERYVEDTFINIVGNKKQSIFKSGVNYFKGEK
ncbi:MAG: phosphoribosylformylglycinamidine synthase subunit PurQ, partial [Erysipelotrichaceae bacterium]